MSSLYDVVFSGEVVPGKQADAVRKELARVLKADEHGINRLFAGKSVVVRKNTDAATAEKYRQAFYAAGAICKLVAVNAPEGAASTEQKAPQNGPPPLPAQPPAVSAAAKTVATAVRNGIILTNIETVPGKTIVEHFGLVSGSTIRAKHVGRDIMAAFKNLVGGEIKSYTKLLQESRDQAIERMVEQARQLGANAVINVRFSTSSVAQGAAELYAYGTAVRVE